MSYWVYFTSFSTSYRDQMISTCTCGGYRVVERREVFDHMMPSFFLVSFFRGSVQSSAQFVLPGHRSIVNQVRFNSRTMVLLTSGVEKIIKVGVEQPRFVSATIFSLPPLYIIDVESFPQQLLRRRVGAATTTTTFHQSRSRRYYAVARRFHRRAIDRRRRAHAGVFRLAHRTGSRTVGY